MSKPGHTIYLADANVLLNLSALGQLDLLRLCGVHLGWHIVVPRCILDEVEGEISGQDLVSRGVELSETDAEVILELTVARAQNEISSRLSDADAELYIRALRTNGTVWTDDGPLVKLLQRKGMSLVHTFAPFIRLCEMGIVTAGEVLECGRRLIEINPRFTERNFRALQEKVESL